MIENDARLTLTFIMKIEKRIVHILPHMSEDRGISCGCWLRWWYTIPASATYPGLLNIWCEFYSFLKYKRNRSWNKYVTTIFKSYQSSQCSLVLVWFWIFTSNDLHTRKLFPASRCCFIDLMMTSLS